MSQLPMHVPFSRWAWALALALALAAGIMWAMAGFAAASHTDSMYKTMSNQVDCFDGTLTGNRTFCQTDNLALTVWRENSITSVGKVNIGGMLDRQFRPTDLTVTFTANPAFVGDAETDVIYIHRDIPAAAIAWCNDAVSDIRCDQHYNAFDTDTPTPDVACHESGHAVGLTHGQDANPAVSNQDNLLGCLQTPIPLTNTGQLGSHNSGQINGTY